MSGAALLTTTADPPCTSSSAVLLGGASSTSGTPLSSLPWSLSSAPLCCCFVIGTGSFQSVSLRRGLKMGGSQVLEAGLHVGDRWVGQLG